jgi:hypothetical protein
MNTAFACSWRNSIFTALGCCLFFDFIKRCFVIHVCFVLILNPVLNATTNRMGGSRQAGVE